MHTQGKRRDYKAWWMAKHCTLSTQVKWCVAICKKWVTNDLLQPEIKEKIDNSFHVCQSMCNKRKDEEESIARTQQMSKKRKREKRGRIVGDDKTSKDLAHFGSRSVKLMPPLNLSVKPNKNKTTNLKQCS